LAFIERWEGTPTILGSKQCPFSLHRIPFSSDGLCFPPFFFIFYFTMGAAFPSLKAGKGVATQSQLKSSAPHHLAG
jgi:hypothetical protein